MFEGERTLRGYLANVTQRLDVGGAFIGTTIDSDRLVSKIREAGAEKGAAKAAGFQLPHHKGSLSSRPQDSPFLASPPPQAGPRQLPDGYPLGPGFFQQGDLLAAPGLDSHTSGLAITQAHETHGVGPPWGAGYPYQCNVLFCSPLPIMSFIKGTGVCQPPPPSHAHIHT